MNDEYYLQIAANMVGDGDPGLLNYKLVDFLHDVNVKLQKVRATLLVWQTIALAITTWQHLNPNERAYGE